MKKTLFAILTLAGLAAFGQIAVPPGAVMETTIPAVVPVSSIKITRLVCDMTNAAPTYAVSFELTGENGRKASRTVKISQEQAAAMMQAAGYSLTNIVGSALGAIQVMIDQQLARQ